MNTEQGADAQIVLKYSETKIEVKKTERCGEKIKIVKKVIGAERKVRADSRGQTNNFLVLA